jgi:hypothetical protein
MARGRGEAEDSRVNVLVLGARAPIAADLVRALAQGGHHVWLADSFRVPVSASIPSARGCLRLPAPRADFARFQARLATVCTELDIGAVVPASEEVFWLAGAASALPRGVNVRTSPAPVLARLHHKGSFARLAVSLGYGAAENHILTEPADVAKLGDPSRFVFKPVYSRFASRIVLRPSPRAAARLRPSPTCPWLGQTFVVGRELCSYNVAEAGRLLLHVGYEPKLRYGVGASVYFSPVVSESLRVMSERFIAATRFTGQISFDAIETVDGLVALECNPRGTSGVHLAVQQPEIFSGALLGELKDSGPLFLPEARLLLVPLLLAHPRLLLNPDGRALLRETPDAMQAAGISRWWQMMAIAELALRAGRRWSTLACASTADIEWNGESLDE